LMFAPWTLAINPATNADRVGSSSSPSLITLSLHQCNSHQFESLPSSLQCVCASSPRPSLLPRPFSPFSPVRDSLSFCSFAPANPHSRTSSFSPTSPPPRHPPLQPSSPRLILDTPSTSSLVIHRQTPISTCQTNSTLMPPSTVSTSKTTTKMPLPAPTTSMPSLSLL
jgi:hypothetical protein